MIKNILKNNHFKSIITQGGASGIAIISFIILVRTMKQETFGQWGLFLALVTFIDLLKSGLVSTALIKFSSGQSKKEKNKLLSSSWILNIISLLIITVIFYFIYYIDFTSNISIKLFLFYYPIYGFISMPYFYNEWNARIEINMSRLLKFKIFNTTLFLIVCILSLYIKINIEQLVIYYILTFLLSSILSLTCGKTGFTSIKKYSKARINQLVVYGRYNILAFLGANLLRSSDTFLISAFLGDKAVALYLIPQRLWILVITPLASVNTISFPLFSSSHNNKLYQKLKTEIEKYIGVLTLLYIPFSIFLFIISKPLVLMIAGEKYVDAIILFRIFLVYSLFVPFDQIIGVALDAINKPEKNFKKVAIMTVTNIIGDLVVLILFKDINLVAWVTLLTVLSGALSGYNMLSKFVPIKIISIFSLGYKNIYNLSNKCLEKLNFYKSNMKTL